MIEYFLNDPYYLNDVATFEVLGIHNHFPHICFFRNIAIEIYGKISEELNLKKDSLIIKNLKGYEHYIGTYIADSLNTINIKEEKNELVIYELKQQDSTVISKSKFHPDSKTYFTWWNVFGQLNFDKNNEVIGLVLSRGSHRFIYEKVK